MKLIVCFVRPSDASWEFAGDGIVLSLASILLQVERSQGANSEDACVNEIDVEFNIR